MTLLKPGKIETAYFKAGIYGLTKTGKTYTATKIAMGLWHYIHKKLNKKPNPIAFADTEAGSDFVLDRFTKELKETGFLVTKTRAFQDLIEIVNEAEKNCSILIVDSITHYWNEMLNSYMEKKKIKRLTLNHWPELKKTWREYSDKYVNSKLHIIMCGRSADLWEDVENEEGIKELKKVGTRMKAEGEMGYESNLLVEMELHKTGPRIADKYVNRAWVNGDKFDRMNFLFFDNPKFDDFLPHISRLKIGGTHKAVDTTRDSKEMFEHGDAGYQRAKKREILIDRINAEIADIYPSRSAEDTQNKRELMRAIFETPSRKEIQAMRFDDLEVGLKKILEFREEITVKKKDTKEGKKNGKT